jgi:uncharacterized protein YbjT (DUF2867 family)
LQAPTLSLTCRRWRVEFALFRGQGGAAFLRGGHAQPDRGTDRLESNGYFRAKLAQERLIAASGLAYTILRATQFYEFVGAIADSGRSDGAVHASSQLMQPLLSDEVAVALADVTVGEPANGIREVAGPEAAPLSDFVGRWLRKQGDTSRIVAGADVPYFGAPLALRTLVPDDGARIMPTRFDEWLGRAAA